MTLPVPLSLVPTCQLWVDGKRFADGATDGELPDDPVVLTDLKVTWGRDNILDQPEPGSCVFEVLDEGTGVKFTDLLHIGSTIDIRAHATIYPDPTVPIFTYNPGFEDLAAGAVPASLRVGATAVVTTAQAASGTRSVQITPDGSRGTALVIFPPAPFSANESAWDAIPKTAQAQTWTLGASVRVPTLLGVPPTVRIRAVIFTDPTGAPNSWSLLPGELPVVADGTWQTLSVTAVPPDGVWLGVGLEMAPTAPRWNDPAYTLAWDDPSIATVRWDDPSVFHVDNLQLLAPAGGAAREAVVFSGRLTDMRARYSLDQGATIVQCTAQTHLAELNNRYVGSEPWLVETLANRFGRIVDLSGQQLRYKVDSSVQGVSITWRDVDNQPAGDLLHQLAESVGGALWSAFSDTVGTYLWLEDIGNRPSLWVLVRDPDLVIRIKANTDPTAVAAFTPISSCDIDLEPVEWLQTTEDDATRVVVTYQEQGVDTDGKTKITSRDVTADDPAAELLSGRRRIQTTTQLSDPAYALILAQSMLARVQAPNWRLSGLTWDVASNDRLDSVKLGRLMTVLDGVTRLGMGIMLTDVPAWFSPASGADIPLFLEGGTYRNVDGAWELELLTSSAKAQGKTTVRWDDVPGDAIATRTNAMYNPRATSTGAAGWLGTRGFGTGGAGAYSFITGQTAPVGNVTTARRKTWTTGCTNNTSTGFQVQADAGNAIPVSALAGKTVTVTAFMRNNSGTAKNYAMIVQTWTSLTGGLISTITGGTVAASLSSSTWTKISLSFVMPANAVGLTVFPDVVAGGTNWAAGNTLDCTGILIEDTGASGASRTNRVPNPQDRTGGAAGWLTTRTFGAGGAGTHTHSQAVAAPGSAPSIQTACRKTWTTASTSPDQTGLNLAATATDWFAVTAGEKITVSAYMRHNSTTAKDLAIYVAFYAGTPLASAAVGTSSGSANTTVSNTAWVRVSYSFTVPAGAAGMRIITDVRSGAGPWAVNEWLDVTGLQIEVATAVGTYFDGATAATATVTNDWVGSAWASASIQTTVPGYFDGSMAATATEVYQWATPPGGSMPVVDGGPSTAAPMGANSGWQWDQMDASLRWDDLTGVGI